MPRTQSMQSAALALSRMNIAVFPLHSINKRGRCTCGRADCPSPGKHPRVRWKTEATTDPATIRKWFDKWPTASLAVQTASVLVLDIDVRGHDGHGSLAQLIEDNGALPDTAIAETGEYEGVRGQHRYFLMPEDRRVRSKTGVRDGIDIRAEGGYVVAPPSPHSSGVRYEWIFPISEIVEAPEWLLDLAPPALDPDDLEATAPKPTRPISKSTNIYKFLIGTYHPDIGEQRDFLVKVARSLWRTGMDLDTAVDRVWEGEEGEGGICACEQGDPPWTEEDVHELVADIYASPPSSPLDNDRDDETHNLDNDLAIAKRIVESYPEGHLFAVPAWERFYIWDSKRHQFDEDSGLALKRQIKDVVVPELKAEAAKAPTDASKRLFSLALEVQKRPRIQAGIWAVDSFTSREAEELNADPFLLAVINGVIDLRTGSLRNLKPQDLITKRCRAEFDPDAKSRTFDRFLKQIVPDKDLRDYLQKAFGYSLTGKTQEHKFFYVHGRPGSGKGTLVDTFAYLMGSYAESAQPDTFMKKRDPNGSGPTDDLARLAHARFVIVSEPEKGAQFAAAMLSQLTGQDPVTARKLHQSSFTFIPQFKLWFTANHKPYIGSTRSGAWRRMKVIPIDQQIAKPDQRLRDYKMRQAEVLSAMLAWAVEGAIRWWDENGRTGKDLEDAPIVEEAVEDFYEEEDQVGRFLQDVVAQRVNGKAANKARVAKRTFYAFYEDWCRSQGIRYPRTIRAFGAELKSDHKFKSSVATWDGGKSDCWIGLRLQEPHETTTAKHR